MNHNKPKSLGHHPVPSSMLGPSIALNPLLKSPTLPGLLPIGQYVERTSRVQEAPYLPIEFFRKEELLLQLLTGEPVKKFQSSGTTSHLKSHSWFSAQGLRHYHEGSVSHFFEILNLFFKNKTHEFSGISLVPDPCTWPESSLAQMVGWISEKTPITYATHETIEKTILQGVNKEPHWVFGTAFHFVNLFDQGTKIALPPGSIVIETGGTKGQSRSVEKHELYEIISNIFSISQNQILSEYGMSELACQAYDAYSISQSSLVSERRYRFHPSVDVAVMTEPGILRPEGEGLLVIWDPSRVDFPWPIRTEDRVELSEDRSFKLLGRAHKTPIKGCSTSFEHLLRPAEIVPTITETPYHREYCSLPSPLCDTADNFLDSFNSRKQAFLKFPHLLDRSLFIGALQREFENETVALWACEDLFSRFPDESTLDKLFQNFHREIRSLFTNDSKVKPDSRWLIILPENHSIVGYYPILLAYLFGLTVSIRIPHAFNQSESAFFVFLDECQKHLPGFDHIRLSAAFRLKDQFNQTYDTAFSSNSGILCYGSEKTTRQIEKSFPDRTQGFGESWALSLIHSNDIIEDRYEPKRILKDFLSLNQKGCRSARILIIVCDSPDTSIPYEKIINQLMPIISKNKLGHFISRDVKLRESLEFESIRYRLLGFKTYWNQFLIPYDKSLFIPWDSDQSVNLDLSSICGNSPGILPLLSLKPTRYLATNNKHIFYKKIVDHILLQPYLSQVNLSSSIRSSFAPWLNDLTESLNIYDFGMGNQERWDGSHQGKRLFLDMRSSKPPQS